MEATQLLGYTVAFAAAAFLVGVVVYLAVSFTMVRHHNVGLATDSTWRAVLHEAFWVVLTQPLLPLFYVLGRRMGGTAAGVPVVLVHGYAQNRVNFLRIARRLHRAGSGPIYGFNYLWTSPIASSAERLAHFIEEVRRAHDVPKVNLVCHSLGGVIALEYVRANRSDRVNRCVTVASPHAGVAWRGPVLGTSGRELRRGSDFFRARSPSALAIPCLSIASTHDNVVHPVTTSELGHSGGHDLVVQHFGHLTMLFAPTVVDAVVSFLAEESRDRDSLRLEQDSEPARLSA